MTPFKLLKAPSSTEVTSCSKARGDASGQLKLTEIELWVVEGFSWTGTKGGRAAPMRDRSRKVMRRGKEWIDS